VLEIEYLMHLFLFLHVFFPISCLEVCSYSSYIKFPCQLYYFVVLSTSIVWYAFRNVLGKLEKNKNATTVKLQCFDDNSKVLMHAPTTRLNLLNGNYELRTKLRILTLPSKLVHFLKPSIPIGLFCILTFI